MRVQIDDAVAVGPTNSFGEIRSWRQRRGRLDPHTARRRDRAPDRLQPGARSSSTTSLVPLPAMNVGDHYTEPARRGARLRLRQVHDRGDAGADGRPRRRPAARSTRPADARTSSRSPPSTSRTSRRPIRRRSTTGWRRSSSTNLRAPDLIAVEEVQDNNGATDDGVVAADVDARQADRRDPGGRRPDLRVPRDRPGRRPGRRPAGRQHPRRCSCSAPTAASASSTRRAAARRPPSASPPAATCASARAGSIPTNPAWTTSRKPLAGEFTWHGQQAVRDREPLQLQGRRRSAGRAPPAAAARLRDAAAPAGDCRADFVERPARADPTADVVVLGDLNDFQFSETGSILEAAAPARPDRDAACERAVQLRLRGQLPGARPHPGQRRPVRRAARLRRRPRQLGVRRPGVGPRAADRQVDARRRLRPRVRPRALLRLGTSGCDRDLRRRRGGKAPARAGPAAARACRSRGRRDDGEGVGQPGLRPGRGGGAGAPDPGALTPAGALPAGDEFRGRRRSYSTTDDRGGTMSRLRFQISMSLDGFIAGPDQSVEDPLGKGGMQLHEWVFGLAAWRGPHGLEGGEVNASTQVDRGGAREHRRDDHGPQHVRRPRALGGRAVERLVGRRPAVPSSRLRAHAPSARQPLELEGGTTFHVRHRRNRVGARAGPGGGGRQGRLARRRSGRRPAVPPRRARRRDDAQRQPGSCSGWAAACSTGSPAPGSSSRAPARSRHRASCTSATGSRARPADRPEGRRRASAFLSAPSAASHRDPQPAAG